MAKPGTNNQAQYRPLVLPNNNGLGGTFSTEMIRDVNTIYHEGFAFDLNSLNSVGNKDHLNLYFNQSGSGRNDNHQIVPGKKAPIRSSKIGLLDDVLSFKDNGWQTNLTTPITTNLNAYQAIVTNDSFANLITSHVNLEK